jgi:hypothetical protein
MLTTDGHLFSVLLLLASFKQITGGRERLGPDENEPENETSKRIAAASCSYRHYCWLLVQLKVGRGNEKCRSFLYLSAMLLNNQLSEGLSKGQYKLPVLTVATSSHVDQMDPLGCFSLDK